MIVGMEGVLNKLDPKPESEEGREAGAEGEGEGRVSLAEAIETRKFLGREFLVWFWFLTEIYEQKLQIPGLGEGRRAEGEGGDCDAWLEKSIVFESLTESGKEKASLSGVAPSGGPESREALRQGKTPVKAKIAIRLPEGGRREAEGERAGCAGGDFSFVFDADHYSISNAKIPALLKGQGDDPFQERMTLIEQLEGIVDLFYQQFLAIRVSSDWNRVVGPAIRSWMSDDGSPYELLRAKLGTIR